MGYRDGGIGAGGIECIGFNADSRNGEATVWEGIEGACVGLPRDWLVELGDIGTSDPLFPPFSCCAAAAAAAAS